MVTRKTKAPAKPKAPKFEYIVAAGKSITSKKGIRGPGEEIKAAWVPGGQDTIDSLVKSGMVVKN